MRRRGGLGVVLALLAGCAGGERYDRPLVSEGLRDRGAGELGPSSGGLPPGVDLVDGVDEEEAVALALWNNAAFQEALADLGVRRAEIIAAGQIPNPVLTVLFPISPKSLEFTAKLPLEFLWLRPARLAAAEFDAERVAAILVQSGLDLIRDVRLAYADLGLAEARKSAAATIAALRAEALSLMEARLRAGDVSEAEVALARADALQAGLERDRAARELDARSPALEALTGAAAKGFRAGAGRSASPGPERALLDLAFESRPDLRGARLSLDAASERANISDLELLALTGILDANQPHGPADLEMGPGVDVTIPIFNQNQGNRARAEAELERASRHYRTMRAKISLEVRTSRAAVVNAAETRDAIDARIRPAVDAAVGAARRAYDAGDLARPAVVELEIRAAQVELRRAEAAAELRRALAELERSVGRRLP